LPTKSLQTLSCLAIFYERKQQQICALLCSLIVGVVAVFGQPLWALGEVLGNNYRMQPLSNQSNNFEMRENGELDSMDYFKKVVFVLSNSTICPHFFIGSCGLDHSPNHTLPTVLD
jgi:hypothetical protein